MLRICRGTANTVMSRCPAANGETAFIVTLTREKIDSVMVENGKAASKAPGATCCWPACCVNGQRYGNFILEQGDITLQRGGASRRLSQTAS